MAELSGSLHPGYRKNGFAFSLKSTPSFNLVYNQQNLNVINQRGLFILSSSPNEPLEYFFPNKNIDNKERISKIKCYNIHKSLSEYIIFKLQHDKNGRRRKIPIDKDFIYPQEEMIAAKAFQHYLNSDLL